MKVCIYKQKKITQNSNFTFGKKSGVVGRRQFSEDKPTDVASWRQNLLGKIAVEFDEVSPNVFQDMANAVGRVTAVPKAKENLPPTWHLGYFHTRIPESELGEDGYDARYAPPAPFIRRVWAGSNIEFSTENPLKLGQKITQITSVDGIDIKKGSRGETVFVTLKHQISNDNGPSVTDTRTLAYMKEAMDLTGKAPASNFGTADHSRTLILSPISLLRYSAVTYNAHKIHYDFEYSKKVENYPGIVVHGPFTSTLLLEHFSKCFPKLEVSQWNYRALYPIFLTNKEVEIKFNAKMRQGNTHCDLWAETSEGAMAMSGVVSFQDKPKTTRKSKKEETVKLI